MAYYHNMYINIGLELYAVYISINYKENDRSNLVVLLTHRCAFMYIPIFFPVVMFVFMTAAYPEGRYNYYDHYDLNMLDYR